MDKSKIIEQVKQLISDSKDRKFTQSVDMLVNLKHLNMKKQDERVEFFHGLPKGRGKDVKVCALIDQSLKDSADAAGVDYIMVTEFADYKANKRKAVQLARKYDYFIAQANLMGQVATNFGRVFGARGKMPNPKAGCVVPPKGNVGPVVERLKSTVKIAAKIQPVCQFTVGTTAMSAEDLAENIASCYDATVHHLPQEMNNLKNAMIKLTMSKAVILGDE